MDVEYSSRMLRLVRFGGLLYAAASFALAAFTLFVVLSSVTSGGSPAIALPVAHNDITAVPRLAADPSAVDAHFTTVEFTAHGLSAGTSLLFYASRVLDPLAHGIVALAIMVLARDTARGRPFAPAVARGITVAGVTLGTVGMGSQLLKIYGTGLARHELLSGTGLLDGYLPPASLDWSPAFLAAALGILAAVFRHGARLQRDTDGLV
jgi:hypothetical protein